MLAVGVLLAGCGDAADSSSTNAATNASSADSTASATDVGDTSVSTVAATATPTTIPDPTVFNANNVGNFLELSSFVLTKAESHTNNGVFGGTTSTISYIKAPLSASVEIRYSSGDSSQDFIVDGRTYQRDISNFWFTYEVGSLATPNVLDDAEFSTALSYLGVVSAVFVGEEDFGGVPAFHFTFDETDLLNYPLYTAEKPSPEAEGDFYLAKDGNYVLYAHSRQVITAPGFEGIDEFTDTLSSVNGVTAITLPDDILPIKDAHDLGIQLEIPMPADGVLDNMINYNDGGIGVYYYQYTSTWKNEAEFIDFYTNLQPTNGWTVSFIGQVENLDVFCGDGNCVIIKNGDKQVILYFDGSNLHADFDREHQFGPCTQPYSATACG